MKKIYTSVFVISILAWSPTAHASTIYVDLNCANNGTGLANKCATSAGGAGAVNSLGSINCSSWRGNGNSIEFRSGVHRLSTHYNVPANCGGNASGQNYIENAPGADAILIGTRRVPLGSAWVRQAPGVYECGSACSVGGAGKKFPFTAWYDSGSGEKRLNLLQTKSARPSLTSRYVCDSTIKRGEMTYNESAGKMCVHLSNDADPDTIAYFEFPYVLAALLLQNSGVDFLTIRSNPAGGHFGINRFRDHGIVLTSNANIGITIGGPDPLEGIDVGWVMDRCINTSGSLSGAKHYKISRNTVHHCGQEGIRIQDDTALDGIVGYNVIHDIQFEPVFERCGTSCSSGFVDVGTAIRAARMSNTVIRDNEIYNVGGGQSTRGIAINLENGADNVTVDSNYIHDMLSGEGIDENRTSAIRLSTLGAGYSGVTISNNRIHNVDTCFSFDASGSVNGNSLNKVVNNTCHDPAAWGIRKDGGNWTATVGFANNIFVSSTVRPIALISVGSGAPGFRVPISSVFDCPTCTTGQTIINWKGTSYIREQDCLGNNCIRSLNPTLFYGDPGLMLNDASPPSLKLATSAGLAFDHGSQSECAAKDFEDDPRPAGAACDIGADELTTTGAPALLSVTPLP